MSVYAKSKEFHKALRTILDAHLKPIGFKRCKVSVASYYRPRYDNNGYLRFWSQLSQWGDSWSGNSFTLNVDLQIDDPHQKLGDSIRFLGDLSNEQLAEAEIISKKIFVKKPKPPKDHWIYSAMNSGDEDRQFWRKAFERAFTYCPGTLKPNHDIWFEYFSVEDVTRWGEFIAPLLPDLLDKMEKT